MTGKTTRNKDKGDETKKKVKRKSEEIKKERKPFRKESLCDAPPGR